MPRQFLMTWVPSQKRWRKMYKGHVYTIGVERLNLVPADWTKERSYQAANQLWEAKRRELTPAFMPGTDQAITKILEAFAGQKLNGSDVPLAIGAMVNQWDS